MSQKSYIHDKHFLEKHTAVFELCEEESAILVVPDYQKYTFYLEEKRKIIGSISKNMLNSPL